MSRDREARPAGGMPEKRKKSRLSLQQKILIAVAVVLALTLTAVLALRSLFIRPDLENKKPQGDNGDQPAAEEIDYADGLRPRSDGERKSKDYYTVLILGRDTGGGGNTDTMLLASYDVTNQKATVMSVPRDTMVNVPWDIKRINSVYSYYGGGEKGIQHLYKEISQLVGFEPDYQVVVEWEAVGEIVDAMGGVWFDVPRDMNYDDPLQNLSIHQTKGYRLLSGDDAMQVLRYRHDNRKNGKMLGYPEGDLGRIKTQQAFLKAMVEQLLKIQNVPKINQFVEVFQKNVETDLSLQNILWFAKAAMTGGLTIDNVNFVTMPNRAASCWSRSVGNKQSYVTPISSELLDLVNNHLSPFVEVFTLSDLDIMSVNSDGSISSSTGYVEDSRAAKPPVKPQAPAEEEEKPPVDENGNPVDPGTGLPVVPENPDASSGDNTVHPGAGETAPGTGGDAAGTVPGAGDSGTGESGGETNPGAADPGTAAPDTTDPNAGQTGENPPQGGEAPGGDTGTAPVDPGFIIVDNPSAA